MARLTRLVVFVVKADAVNAPDNHAGALDCGSRLESTDVVKPGRHRVRGVHQLQAQQIGRLQGQKQQGKRPDQNKKADPNVGSGTCHD
jgi:hypothetical protein